MSWHRYAVGSDHPVFVMRCSECGRYNRPLFENTHLFYGLMCNWCVTYILYRGGSAPDLVFEVRESEWTRVQKESCNEDVGVCA